VPPARILLYVATAGALSLIGRSVLEGPIPLSVAIAAFALYVALIGSGVAFLRLGMFVDVVWRGPREARGVALTFDDGPSPEHTPKVLDLLDEAGVKATFFVIGRKVAAHPEIVRAIAARGHAVGIHGMVHDRLLTLRSPDTVSDDLAEAIATVEAVTGVRPTLFRPPVGLTSPRVAQALEWFDLVVVGWSVRALDGVRSARADRVADRVIPRLRDGAIVLLHDAAERDDHRPASLDALPRILSAMRSRDLQGVPLDRWITAEAEPGPPVSMGETPKPPAQPAKKKAATSSR
jgi:peptidoglycan/xylan/chitin deacetylase (PgdA/CDA1 family)